MSGPADPLDRPAAVPSSAGPTRRPGAEVTLVAAARRGPALGAAIVDWYGASARDLPWRRPGVDAWAVLVSEVMLQQTPVARVEPVWKAWMRHWPRAADLAAAAPADVIRAWGKLGYPRRALRLREAAIAITERHGGRVPAEVAELEALPGVGVYTARAVACFGHGRPQPVVDTNVRRVLARLVHGRAEAGSARAADLTDVAALAPAEKDRAVRFSVGVMELGALVCVSGTPRCGACPVRDDCAWRRAGCPPFDGPPRRVQRFAGTDRQVRGRLLDVLRTTSSPVPAAGLARAWDDAAQRDRCLDSLLVDGLVEQTPDGRFRLPT